MKINLGQEENLQCHYYYQRSFLPNGKTTLREVLKIPCVHDENFTEKLMKEIVFKISNNNKVVLKEFNPVLIKNFYMKLILLQRNSQNFKH